jgi:hypothetical protein
MILKPWQYSAKMLLSYSHTLSQLSAAEIAI